MNLKRPQRDGWRCARYRAPTGAQLRARLLRLLQDPARLPQALRQPRIQRIMKKPRPLARLLAFQITPVSPSSLLRHRRHPADAPQTVHKVKGIEMLRPKTFARDAGERFPCVQSLVRWSEMRFRCVQRFARMSENRFRCARTFARGAGELTDNSRR